MNSIDLLFERLRAENRKAFIPFITAGDPNLETTVGLLKDLPRRGASLTEIGFPYSDPIADGSVIQASYTRALRGGVCVDDIFGAIKQTTGTGSLGEMPLVAMVSYSLVYHRGPAQFVAQAAAAGLAGAIVPDLPIEEAQELARLSARQNFKLIQLVTPTTPRQRAKRIVELATGFLYCVSVVGITGARAQLPAQLMEQLRWLRSETSLPLCVGFGISKPEQVRELRDVADGIIVGSALVRHLAPNEGKSAEVMIREIGAQVSQLADALSN